MALDDDEIVALYLLSCGECDDIRQIQDLRTERQEKKMAFLGWFVHYILIFVVLAAAAGLGIFVGKKMSDKKNAKAAENTADTEK